MCSNTTMSKLNNNDADAGFAHQHSVHHQALILPPALNASASSYASIARFVLPDPMPLSWLPATCRGGRQVRNAPRCREVQASPDAPSPNNRFGKRKLRIARISSNKVPPCGSG